MTIWKHLSKVIQFQHNETLHEKKTLNHLHPNISIYILSAFFHKFPFVLSRRIHLTIKAFQVGNYPSYPHDPNEWFSSSAVGRNKILVTLRVKEVKTQVKRSILLVFQTKVWVLHQNFLPSSTPSSPPDKDLLSPKKLWWIFVPWISCLCIISVPLLQQKAMFNVHI